MPAKKDIVVRYGCVFRFMIALFVAVLYFIVKIQYFDVIECQKHTVKNENCTVCAQSGKNKWRELGKTGKMRVDSIEAARGNIYDTNGKLLASSVPEYKVRFDIGTEYLKSPRNVIVYDSINKRNKLVRDSVPRFQRHADTMAIVMANVIHKKSVREYKNLLQKKWNNKEKQINSGKKKIGSSCYVFGNTQYIVSYLQLEDEIKKAAIYRQKQHESGLITEIRYTRRKPYQRLANALIGGIYTSYDSEGKGRSGIEQRYESTLRGTKGFSTNTDGLTKITEPTSGTNITLTIDMDLQYLTEQALRKQMQAMNVEEGCAVLMDVKTGKIRSFANLTHSKNGYTDNGKNHAFAVMQEPGSVMKVASMMIALEDGIVQPGDVFEIPGTRDYYFTKENGGGRRVMRDHAHKNPITAAEILQMSLNVGTSDIINKQYKNNPEAYINRLRALGFGISLDFGIGNSTTGKLKTPAEMQIEPVNRIAAKWDKNATLPWLSIGYECQIPPIYTLMFYNAIANNGIMIKPQFVEKIGQQTLLPDTVNPAICSPATLQKLSPMMERVVERAGGTANHTAQTTMFRSAGKTGTSEVINRITLKDGTKTNIQSNQATFCGFFPADKPVYSCIVMLRRKGKGNEIYGAACGPVFREIAEKAYLHNRRQNPASLANMQYVPVIKGGNAHHLQTIFAELNYPLEKNAENVVAGKVINVVGMGLRDAVYYLEKAGYAVSLNNNSRVGTVREVKRRSKKNVELILN